MSGRQRMLSQRIAKQAIMTTLLGRQREAADGAASYEQAFVDGLRKEGLNVVDAKIGDPDPLAAVQDECNLNEYDELVISTLPTHISRWLKLDLPHKAEHATGLPVTHVVAHSAG